MLARWETYVGRFPFSLSGCRERKRSGDPPLVAVLANFIGTTGASMVLIRPWIRTNRARIRGYHIVFSSSIAVTMRTPRKLLIGKPRMRRRGDFKARSMYSL